MTKEKQLDAAVADRIGEYVKQNGGLELADSLLSDPTLSRVKLAKDGLEAMKLFLHYCNLMGVSGNVIFDLSLARGLDYYTGIIYEAVLKGNVDKNCVL